MTTSPYKAELESAIQKKKEKHLALAHKRQKRDDKKKIAMTASNKHTNKKKTKQIKAKQEKAGPSWLITAIVTLKMEFQPNVCTYCNDTFGVIAVKGEGGFVVLITKVGLISNVQG